MARAFLPLIVAASLILACDGDDAPGGGVTPTPVSTAVATVAATPSPGSVTTLRLGDDIELPDDVALIVETGCWQCDGPTSGFIRVYRDSTGEIRIDRLYSPPQTPGAVITGYAATPDGSELALGLCARGTCAHLGPPSEDARTQVLHSTDGGVTWDDAGTLDGSYSLVGLAPGGEFLLAGPFDPAGRQLTGYLLHPSGVVPEPPTGAGPQAFAVARQWLFWWSDDAHRLLLPDGTQALDIGPDRELSYGNPIALNGSDEFVVTAYEPLEESRAWSFVTKGPAGNVSYYQLDAFARPGAWYTAHVLIGNTSNVPVDNLPQASIGYLPAIFDLDRGVIRPIADPFLSGDLLNGRNHVVGVMRGPFARVVAPGDCLRVRAQPAADNIVECAADGVLLRDLGETQSAEGETWLRVATPTGAEGWVSAEFVER